MRMMLLAQRAAKYPARFTSEMWQNWVRFVSVPVDGTMLGPMRILVGLILCWNWLNIGLDLNDWMGPDGWLPLGTAIELRESAIPWGWSFWDFVPASAVTIVYAISALILGAWTIGLKCRILGVFVWLIHYSTIRRLPVMLFGFDSIVGSILLYMALTGTGGESFSVDRRLDSRRHGQPDSRRNALSGIALRLIQLQLCLIYAGAGFSKLLGEPWWDGTAAYYLVANNEFRGFSMLKTMGENHWLMAVGTLVPLWSEILYPVLIWFKTWRPLMLCLVIAMHLMIAMSLGLWEFSLTMIAANFAFVDPAWFRTENAPDSQA